MTSAICSTSTTCWCATSGSSPRKWRTRRSRMRFARARLWVASLLFAAWVGWLGYQAWSRGRDSPILSHSQFLVSTLDVIADVKATADGRPDPAVTVREVHWPATPTDLVGKTITVANLSSSFGYRGPGEYILPLVRGE